jgi:hypothetical protein
MPKSKDPLVAATKPKGKENICSAAMLSFYKKNQQNLHIFQEVPRVI